MAKKDELPDDIEALKAMVMRLSSELAQNQDRHERQTAEYRTIIDGLESNVARLERMVFGRGSERLVGQVLDRRQLGLFNEAEVSAPLAPENELVADRPSRGRRGGGRRRPSKELERIERVIDLGEEEKQCPCCGKTRPRIGEERSEETEIIPAKAVVIVKVRPKYGPCSCEDFDEEEDRAVIQARAPAKIAPGSMFSNRTIAHFLAAKFADGIPFHRQESIVRRMGVDIERCVMARIAMRVAERLSGFTNYLLADIRGSPVARMDETPMQVLKEEGRPPSSQSRMWVVSGYACEGQIVYFHYSPSRAGSVAAGLLGPSWQGYLQSDGYSGYVELGKRQGIEHVGCWAHIRRKFYELLAAQGKGAKPYAIMGYIKELYAIDRDLRERGERKEIDLVRFQAERIARTKPVFEAIAAWLHEQAAVVAPQSPLGKAISYALGQYDRAVRYVEHGLLTPDNNLVENAIRPFVIGRKNWLFADTPSGARASASWYSLIETARLNGHEPFAYLCHLFDRLPQLTDEAEIRRLLPYVLDPKAY